jgi:hypothetical protein
MSTKEGWQEKRGPLTIGAGVLTLGMIFGAASYHDNLEKEGHIPLAFSEIERTKQSFEKEGHRVPPLTVFYSSVNDVSMKVFESNNIALETGRDHSIFAGELKTRVNRALRVHRLITEHAAEIDDDAKAALQSLHKIGDAGLPLAELSEALSRVWSASHKDEYHTELYPVTSCDAKNNCTVSMHTRQVYDYTIHTYTYDPAQGERADNLLKAFVLNYPDMKLDEILHLATEVGNPNLFAIKKSMKEALKGNALPPAQALTYANTWATGSNLSKYYPDVTSGHASLQKSSPAWSTAKTTARSTRYTTYSSSDAGPREYQVIQQALKAAGDMNQASQKILGGIHLAPQAVHQMEGKIREFIDVIEGEGKGDADKLRKEILQLARDNYNRNIENGFDVQPFKWKHVLLFTLLGMALGGGLGFGANAAVDGLARRRQRKIFEFRDNDGFDAGAEIGRQPEVQLPVEPAVQSRPQEQPKPKKKEFIL